MINLIPQSRCFQSNGQCSADKVMQQQIMGVCTNISEITVTRYTLISGRGLHLQQVGSKVWLSSECVTVSKFFMNCLSLICDCCTGMAVHSVHLLVVL